MFLSVHADRDQMKELARTQCAPAIYLTEKKNLNHCLDIHSYALGKSASRIVKRNVDSAYWIQMQLKHISCRALCKLSFCCLIGYAV